LPDLNEVVTKKARPRERWADEVEENVMIMGVKNA
jgi:hypothetical protein